MVERDVTSFEPQRWNRSDRAGCDGNIYRVGQRPTEEPLSDRTFAPSQWLELPRQSAGRADCLHLPAQATLARLAAEALTCFASCHFLICRTHVKKGRKWTAKRYWLIDKGEGWRFSDGELKLLRHAETPIHRHIKVKGTASPYDGNWTYWSKPEIHHLDGNHRNTKMENLAAIASLSRPDTRWEWQSYNSA